MYKYFVRKIEKIEYNSYINILSYAQGTHLPVIIQWFIGSKSFTADYFCLFIH